MHRSPGICLTAEENPGKPKPRDSLIKVVLPFIASWGPLPPNEVGRITQHIREEKEGKKEWREEDSKERPSRKLFVYCIRIIHLRFMGTKRKSYHLD